MLAGIADRAQPVLRASRMDLSLSVRMRGWAASQGSWPGAWAWRKCDPSHCPQDLGTPSLCRGEQGSVTHRSTPVLGKPAGCLIGGPWWPQQSCCGSQSRGCPALRGNQFASGCLGMLQCWHLQAWYRDSSGLTGAPPIVDSDPESQTGLYCGSHPDPTGLAKLKAVH